MKRQGAKVLVSVVYGLGAIGALVFIKIFASIIWSDTEVIFKHVFIIDGVERLSFAAVLILAMLFSNRYVVRLLQPPIRLKNFLLSGIKIGLLTYLSISLLLSFQSLFVGQDLTHITILFSSIFLATSILGGVLFGWIVVVCSLLSSAGIFSIVRNVK